MAIDNHKSENAQPESRTKPAAKPKLVERAGGALTGWVSLFHKQDARKSAAYELDAPKSSDEFAKERTVLAAKRTMMAADRSLMAWIRTGLSMISFGFTIYKLLEGFQESGALLQNLQSPRIMGMFLTGLGTAAIVMGSVEYWHRLEELRQLQYIKLWRPTFIMATIMSVTGVFLFVGIISKLL